MNIFNAIVKGIDFLISLLDCLLFVYRNMAQNIGSCFTRQCHDYLKYVDLLLIC